MSTSLIVSIAVSVATVLILVVVAVVTRVRKNKPGSRRNSGSGTFNGVDYSFSSYAGGKNNPPSLLITIESESSGSFHIRKETGFDRFWKKRGLVKEITTYDQIFDNRFFIDTENVHFTEAVLKRQKTRELITYLFDKGFSRIQQKKKKLIVLFSPYKKADRLENEEIREISEKVAELSLQVKSCDSMVQEEAAEWRKKKLMLLLVPGVVLVAGVVLLVTGGTNYTPLDGGDLFLDSLIPGLAAAVIMTWFAVKVFRERSSSHYVIMVVLITSLFAWPASFTGGKMFLNGYLDDSPGMSHKVRIIGKYKRKTKSSYAYYLSYNSWRNEKIETLRVNRSTYNNTIIKRDWADIVTHTGFYGYEWMEYFEILER